MSNLLIVLDEIDPDACAAAQLVAQALGQDGAMFRYHREDLDFSGLAVAFIAPPAAPDILWRAVRTAEAVVVFATSSPDIRPKNLLWAVGETLLDAAIDCTGVYPSAA